MLQVGNGISIQNRPMTPERVFDLSYSIPLVSLAGNRSAVAQSRTIALNLWGRRLSPKTTTRLDNGLATTVVQHTGAYLATPHDPAEHDAG